LPLFAAFLDIPLVFDYKLHGKSLNDMK